MKRPFQRPFLALFSLTAAVAAHGDIVGLDPSSYQYNHADPGFPQVTSNSIQMTNGVNQLRSIVFYQPQNISQFTASFTYRATSIAACPVGQGLTFFLENDPRGVSAIGASLGGLGYNGITPSAGVAIDLNTDNSQSYAAYGTGGSVTGFNSTNPANAFNGHDINVTLVYANPTLTLTMVDTVTNATYAPPAFLVGSIATGVGGSTALVGFGVSTGNGVGFGGATQMLSNFSFTTPEPSSALGFLGALSLFRRVTRQ